MSRLDELKKRNHSANVNGEEDESNLSRLEKLKKRRAVTSDGSDLTAFAKDYESFMNSDYDEETASDLGRRITQLQTMYDLNRDNLSDDEKELRSYLNKAKYSIVGLSNKTTTQGASGWQKYLDDMEANKQKAEAEREGQTWWDKVSNFILEAAQMSAGMSDTSLPMGTYNATVNALREDESYRQPQDDWSDEQRHTFGSLYLESPAKAYDYAEATNKANNEAKEQAEIEKIKASATSNGWAGAAHTAGAIATAPFGLADFLNDLAYMSAGRDITSDGSVSPFEYSQAVTGGISEHLNTEYGTLDEDIPIIGGKGWGDVYGLGTSIAQSAASAYTLGGTGTLVSYFGQGAASGMKDALSRGASEDQAAIYGIALGAFEGIAEKIGIDNLFKIGSSTTVKALLKNTLKQAGAEGMEEGLTSILSNIADNAIMQDQSNFYAMVEMYMSQGMSEEEAKKKAWMDSIEGIAFDTIAGAVSGEVHGGVATSIQTGISNRNASKVYGSQSQTLVDEALASQFGDVKAVGQKYQDRLTKGKSLSGWNLNELLEVTDKSKLKSAILNRLGELGETSDVSAIADVLIRQAMGEELSSADVNILNNSKAGHTVLAEMNEDNIKSGGLGNNWAESIGTRVINPKTYNKTVYDRAEAHATAMEAMERGSVFKTVEDVEGATGETIKTSESGNTIYEDAEGNAENVTVKKIVSTKGGVKVELDNGKTVSASDLRFSSKEEGLMYEMVARMEVTPETANEIIKTFKPSTVGQASVYFTTVPLAYQYGKMNYKAGLKNINLPKALKQIAYNRGRMDAITEAKAQPKATASTKGKTEATPGKKEIIFEGDFTYDESTASEMQKKSMIGIEVINMMSNLEVHIFESKIVTVDGKSKRVATVNGKQVSAPNGYFTDGNKIYVDINAGNGGEGAMLYTMSHEVTHYIRKWNAKGFKELGDFLIAEYGKQGVPVNALLEAQKQKIRKRYADEGKTLPSEAKLADIAYEELVADAMSDMFTDPKAYEKLAKLKNNNFNVWQKLGEAIKALIDKLKTALGIYKTADVPVAQEAMFVRGFSADVYEKLQDLYIKAFVEADNNYSSAEKTLVESGIAVNPDTESASLLSVRDVLSDDQRQNVSKALATRFGVTQKEAMDWLKAETSMASLILNPKYSQYLDYTPDPNEVAIKQNSDYPQGTVDFSPICAKRREFTSVMNNILRLFPNHVFAATDLAKIRTIMQEEGMTIPCGICYVEDRRQLDTIVAQNFIDSLKLYREGSKTRPDGKPFNANQLKGLSLIDGESYTPSVYELVSLEGLNVLKEKNPNMAEAWIKFNNARGMQSVRLLANEAEYKRQILKYTKQTVKAKNDKGGLRVYSFSDAEMFHLIDIIQVITDSATVGLSLQGYTKVNEYARAVKDTGEKLNRSLIPKGELGYHIEDGKVVLDYDTVEGIDINHPDFFDNRDNPNVGNITIGVSDVQIRAAMVSDFVDQIIPFHTGQSEEVLGEKGISTWSNYKDFQTEKDIATGKVSDHQINIYTEVLQVLEKEGKPITKRTFVEKFLQVCKENGLTPRFSQFLNTNERGEYVYTEGYHKMLVDFKTFAQTEVGEYLPQMPVKPIFDNEYITKILKDYVKSQKVKDAELAESMPKVIERITNEIVKPSETMYSERDFSYDELVAKDDLIGFTMGANVQVPLRVDGSIDAGKIVSEVRKQCQMMQTESASPTYFLDVPDIGRNVEITEKGITHGFFDSAKKNKKPSPRDLLNAKVSLAMPEILANSIEVNRSKRGGNRDILFTHIMMGTVGIENDKGVTEYYAVRSVIEERTNLNPLLVEAKILGKLHAVNAKKIDSPNLKVAKNSSTRGHDEVYRYTIADLLEDVKSEFADTFSLDVYKKLGVQRQATDFSKDLLFSDRDSTYMDAVNRGDMETAQRMVDEAAREAGYDTDAYHGTNQGNFTVFDWDKTQRADGGFYGRGHYFTKSEGMAKLYGNRIVKGKLKLGKSFVWSKEVNSYKGQKAPELLSHNIVSRINMAKLFPDIFANQTMSYWEYDTKKGENVEKTIKWGELEGIVNSLSKGLTLREYADGTYKWHTEGRFWEVPVGESYSSVEKANEGKFFAAINALKEKYDGLFSDMTFDDQTTYTQRYGTEITETLKKKGYTSAMDTPEGGEIVVFDSNQVKSADPVTYDDEGKVIPLSERFNPKNNDIRYSGRDTTSYAPTFYSHMGKVIDGIKLDKMGANGVVPYLKGKGVKDEEIKWSGIEAFLEGKKSVTKAELQEFVARSMLVIEENLGEGGASITLKPSSYGDDSWDVMRGGEILDTYSWSEDSGLYESDMTGGGFATTDRILDHFKEKYGSGDTRWSRYKLDGGTNYRELVFKMPNSSYSNQAMRMHWGEDAEGVLAHARIQDMTTADGRKMLFIEEIQSDWHNEGRGHTYEKESTLDSLYYRRHSLYEKSRKLKAEISAIQDKYKPIAMDAKTQQEWDDIYARFKEEAGVKQGELSETENEIKAITTRLNNAFPDAPFRDTYHEYVLKRLLRMAAEEGYDSIGWTTADIQSERWSDQYAEGYRIEYDQDIPKFLRKYGKKWGATVGKAAIAKEAKTVGGHDLSYYKNKLAEYEQGFAEAETENDEQYYSDRIAEMKKLIADWDNIESNGTEIWSMDITDSMKDSVLYEGQVMYSERDPDAISNRTLLANALEGVAQNDIERRKLAQYKSKIAIIERAQAKLAEIRAEAQALRFKKGRTEAETRQMRVLDAEATRIENRIATYDKQLLSLETTTALKNVLQREKEMLRRRLEQKGKEAVKAQRQKDAATIREIMTRNTESRKKAVESRHKTEMRQKIKNVVSDLNRLLLNPTKDQHVPIGLQGVVAEALDAINMDTMNAEERVAYYNDLISRSSNPDEIAMLERKRDFFAYRDANFKDKITALKNAYAEFKESDDPLIREAHNEAIENLIRNTADAIGNKSLKDMSYEQLEAVYDMYKAILATVRNSNKLFKEGRQETISDNSEAVKTEVREVGGHKDRVLKLTKALKQFGWGMLKPITAMKAIGSKTFAKLFDNVRKAEDTWAVDVSEAKKFYDEMSAKYGFKKWDFKKRYTFKDSAGNDFTLSLEQIMSLYAYSKREQADKHLEFGGFIFDDAIEVTEKKLGVPLKYEVNDANPYRLRTEDLLPVVSALTTEQKGFVDEMQTYLSDVMGAKGNEVSLAMYDIKLYKEKNYFPLKTSRYFREFDPEKSATPKIKNAGFSKKTVPQAGNPIVLSNFMDVWAGHVNDMSMYHAFVLPLEDFMRVYNYSSTAGGYDSVQQYIKNAYGAQANQYIEKLMNDLNGGARVDPSASLISQGLSLFKKASVFASASVVVQQPSAIARAVAYINPKYFATATPSAMNLAKHKAVWAEVKKYAPVAVIKEMGYFDTGVGRSTVEWIKGNQTLKDKMDDALSKAPAIADELAWTYIWEAVKRETKATTTLEWGSEEFLKKCGERFTEIITNTQVYDSVLSRSDMMRSKDTGMKMATAFMAEPTTTANMMVDGILQGKRGNKKFTAATVGAVASSIILNSILVALVYAARDDDEDETYAEKYVGSLTTELLDGFNPLTYIPFVKDFWSIAQGYDVERSDMSVISKLWESIEGMFNEDKSGWEKVLEVSGAVSSLFGIPLKNIIRDAKGMFNLTETILSGTPTTKGGIGEAIEESFKSSIPLWDRLNESKTNSDRLYDAILSGDQAQIDRIKSRYDDEKAIESAMRQALRENDSRIKEAAQAKYEGNIAEYTRIAKEIIAEGNFSQDTVVGAINSAMTALKKDESTEDVPTDDRDEATSIYSATDVSVAFDNGDTSTALEIIDDLINTKMANGKTKKEAQSSIRSSMTSYWKPLYKQAYQSGNYTEMERIRRILYSSGLYGTANDVVKTAKNWLKD